LGNRETISRCGELVKPCTSVEILIEYRVQGWKFSVRTIKGKRYITIRRKDEVKSLDPYSGYPKAIQGQQGRSGFIRLQE
jgi:hypothetical protein